MPATRSLLQRAIALVALLFGAMTLFAGTRVLLGNDPGYVVYRPLLLYNVVMGAVYLLAGLIFMLNAAVLAGIVYLHQSGAAVAVDSVRAMVLRTVVWLLLFAGLVWTGRRQRLLFRS